MASPTYIDSAYVGHAIGDARRDSLCPSAAALTQLMESATAKVRAAILHSGYSPPSVAELATLDNSGPLLKLATLGALLPMLYGRQGQEVPPQFNGEVGTWGNLAAGSLPLEDLAPQSGDGVGGSRTKTASTVDSDPDPVFANLGSEW